MSILTSPDRPTVEGAYTASELNQLQAISEDSYKAQLAARLLPGWNKAGENFLKKLDDWGQKNIVEPLISIFQGLTPKGWEHVAEAWEDGQHALNDRFDLLSPLLDYGTAYMETVGGFLEFGNNHGQMKFNKQLGVMRGCEIVDGGIRLLSAGLWDVRAQLTFENTAINVGSGHVDWRVAVYRPDGSMFSRQRGIEWNVRTVTGTIVSSVVVPAPGYVVKVEISWIHGSRRLVGGSEFTRLTVQHISNRTDIGAMGNETSPDIDTNPDREETPNDGDEAP